MESSIPLVIGPWFINWIEIFCSALHNVEMASFFRWYLTVEFQDPAYAKRFHCTHEILEDHMKNVRFLLPYFIFLNPFFLLILLWIFFFGVVIWFFNLIGLGFLNHFGRVWSIWTHRNEVIFRGCTPSVDAILHNARGLASFWLRGGLGPSISIPL